SRRPTRSSWSKVAASSSGGRTRSCWLTGACTATCTTRSSHRRRHRPVRWTVHGERPIYESDWVSLSMADVELPDGRRFDHHVVRAGAPAAGVVVHDPDRGFLLIWRHRFITDRWGWEVPAGRLDEGESAEDAAARETLEETG